MAICTSCGNDVTGKKFCQNCGTPVQPTGVPAASGPTAPPPASFCTNCGRQGAPGERFCSNCGCPLGAATTTGAPVTQSGTMLPGQYPPQQPQYPQQYPPQTGQMGYQPQPMLGQQPMVLHCPVCMAMSPLGTPSCPSCHTSLAGIVPTPAAVAQQGQQGGILGGLGGMMQGNAGKYAMGALGGAAAVLGGEMLMHGVERNIEERVEGDMGYGYEEHHHHHHHQEGMMGELGELGKDIGLF